MLKFFYLIFVFGSLHWSAVKQSAVDAITLDDIFASFSSVVVNWSNALKTISNAIDAAIEEDCVYKCSNGNTPKRNPYYVARGNGCGIPGLQIPTYVPTYQLEKCCEEHDVCYGTCNKHQHLCDATFKECLYKICSSSKKLISDKLLKGCKIVAKTMYTAVTAMGCKYYLDAQEEACICYEGSRDEF